MSDLISRQATVKAIEPNNSDIISRTQAIDALRDYLVEKRCPDDGTLACRLIENEVINKLPSVQPEQRWIPVTERLPEIDKEVLVTDGELCRVCSLFEPQDNEDGLYQWEDNYGHWHEFGTWVAWMPLPEAYQDGEQG